MEIPLVLITGASGLLGREVVKESLKFWKVLGIIYSRNKKEPHFLKCDLLQQEIESIIENVKPNYIVHCAAERFPDKVENQYEKTRLLNVDVTGRLACCAKNIGSKFIYISTDYVFDGSSPPYKNTDTPNPINKYGQTKYDGEILALKENPDSCILRIPILYGDVEYIGESAVTALLPLVLDPSERTISDYEKRYPSSTRDIAFIVRDLIKLMEQGTSIKGVYQWCGKEQLTKYGMAKIIAKVFGLTHGHLLAGAGPSKSGVSRPRDSKLDTSRLADLDIDHHTSFEEGILESLKFWVDKLGKHGDK